jgi:hypothetical protein
MFENLEMKVKLNNERKVVFNSSIYALLQVDSNLVTALFFLCLMLVTQTHALRYITAVTAETDTI